MTRQRYGIYITGANASEDELFGSDGKVKQELLPEIPSPIDVIDSLTSDSAEDALSAKQGKILKGLLDNATMEAQALTFDSTPTAGSAHPVTSNGIIEAIKEGFYYRVAGDSSFGRESVHIDTLAVYNSKGSSSYTVDDTFTLAVGSRYLVLTKDNSVTLRANIAALQAGDVVLLGQSADNGIDGGVLYGQYVYSRIGPKLDASVVGGPIMDVDTPSIPQYIKKSTGLWTTDATSKSLLFPVKKGDKFLIKANANISSYYAFLNTDEVTTGTEPDYVDGTGLQDIAATTFTEATAPDDCFMAVTVLAGGHRYRPAILYKLGLLQPATEETLLRPLIEYGGVDATTGHIVDNNNANPSTRKYSRTARYIKARDQVSIRILQEADNIVARVFEYNGDHSLITSGSFSAITNEFTRYSLDPFTKYIKILLRNSATTATDVIDIEVMGDDIRETYNELPSDSGYQRICVRVNMTDPHCCDDDTDDVQDEADYGVDYGVLALPSSYTPDGVPTRLIIYCHGAAVNYADNVTRFNSQDLEPQYWLKEGYAVMDMEGNPFNNEDEHFGIPQAYECYLAGYKWVTNAYNIRPDGVFLGGRSMGGLMTMNILSHHNIPIIAACPNVPCVLPQWYWNYMSAERRTFCANHMGFVNQPDSWSGTTPMPQEEWDCLVENADKFKMYSPVLRMLTLLPTDEEMFDDSLNGKESSARSAMITLFGKCSIKTDIPVKLFEVLDDTTATPDVNGMLLAKMMRNGCNIFELRLFESGGHHYDTQNLDLRASVTTKYGEDLANIPVVYIEMLQFWRRFEQ